MCVMCAKNKSHLMRQHMSFISVLKNNTHPSKTPPRRLSRFKHIKKQHSICAHIHPNILLIKMEMENK